MSLYDYGLGTLAQYELTADRSARTRGALLCYTSRGISDLEGVSWFRKKLENSRSFAETSGKWYKYRLFSSGIIRKVWSVR